MSRWLVAAGVCVGVLAGAWLLASVGNLGRHAPPSGEVSEVDQSDEVVASLGLEASWEYATSSVPVWMAGAPFTGHGMVYASIEGAVYALDRVDGSVRWRYEGREPVDAGVAVEDGVVVGVVGRLVGLDEADGAVRWSRSIGPGVRWVHLVAGDGIVVGVESRGSSPGSSTVVWAFDTEGGSLWSVELDGTPAGPPTIAGDQVAVPTFRGVNRGLVRGLDVRDGRQWWEVEVEGPASTVAGDLVVYAASRHEIVAVDADLGEERWRTPIDLDGGDNRVAPDVTFADGRVWVVSPDAEPVAVVVDGEGQPVTQTALTSLGNPQGAALTVLPPMVVGSAAGRDGQVVRAVSLDDEVVWERPVDGARTWYVTSVPEIEAGQVWAATSDGQITALGMEGDSEWTAVLPVPTAELTGPLATSDGDIVTIADTRTRVVHHYGADRWLLNATGDTLNALDAATGERVWERDGVEAPWLRAYSPRGSVFVVDRHDAARRVLELSPESGGVMAEVTLPRPVNVTALTVMDDVLYVSGGSGLIAVDTDHRRVRWSAQPDVAASSLVEADGHLIVTTAGGHLLALDPTDGSERWTTPVESCTPAAVVDDIIAVGTEDGIVGLDAASGQRLWQRTSHSPRCAPLATAAGRVITTDLVHSVEALDPQDGELVWTLALDHPVAAPIGAGGDVVAVADITGTVRLLKAADGLIIDRRDIGYPAANTPLVFLHDGLVVVDRYGTIHAMTIE